MSIWRLPCFNSYYFYQPGQSCQYTHLLKALRVHMCCNCIQPKTLFEFNLILLSLNCCLYMYFEFWTSKMRRGTHTDLCVVINVCVCVYGWEVEWYSRGQQETMFSNDRSYHLLALRLFKERLSVSLQWQPLVWMTYFVSFFFLFHLVISCSCK